MNSDYRNEPAYPVTKTPNRANETQYLGMTIRDHFAGLAMQALLSNWSQQLTGDDADMGEFLEVDIPRIAELSYIMSEHMAASREVHKED